MKHRVTHPSVLPEVLAGADYDSDVVIEPYDDWDLRKDEPQARAVRHQSPSGRAYPAGKSTMD